MAKTQGYRQFNYFSMTKVDTVASKDIFPPIIVQLLNKNSIMVWGEGKL